MSNIFINVNNSDSVIVLTIKILQLSTAADVFVPLLLNFIIVVVESSIFVTEFENLIVS